MRLIHALIFIYLFLIILMFYKYNAYDNYKNEPYITVVSRGGLNNRIRVILSYLYKANKEGKKLRVIWIRDGECPDDYDNLFEPLDNTKIITYRDDDIDFETWQHENEEYIKEKYPKFLIPILTIRNTIDEYKQLLNNNYIACHIRRTDIVMHEGQPWYKPKTDDEYMDFIDSYDNKLKIYIATDNKDTQDVFIKKYGDRLVIKKIVPSKELRQTSIQDAVVDMYICVDAKYFLGSHGSSFSDSILYLRE
jgi:hypothetical protein